MSYKINGLPENLPPGKYQTRLVEVKLTKDGLDFELDFIGPYDPADPCLIPLIKWWQCPVTATPREG
jgi:hypothetical protein